MNTWPHGYRSDERGSMVQSRFALFFSESYTSTFRDLLTSMVSGNPINAHQNYYAIRWLREEKPCAKNWCTMIAVFSLHMNWKTFQREEDPTTLAPPILLLPREIIFSLLLIPSLTHTLGPFLPNPQPTQADLQLIFISQSVYRGSWWHRPKNEKEREKGCDDTSVCIVSTLRHLLRCPDLADHPRSLLGMMLGEE